MPPMQEEELKKRNGRSLLDMLTEMRGAQTLGSSFCQKGNHSKGYDIYRNIINQVLDDGTKHLFKAEHLKLLDEVVDRAEKTMEPREKSWMLRTGIDAVYDSCIGNVSEISASMIPSLQAEIKKTIADASSLVDFGYYRSAVGIYLKMLKAMDNNKAYKDLVSASLKSFVKTTVEFAETTKNDKEASTKARETLDRIYDEIRLPEVHSPSAGPEVAAENEATETLGKQVIINFCNKEDSLFDYNLQAVDDSVMRGHSESHLELVEEKNYLRFYGKVSKFNRGGFASFRIVPTCLQSMHDCLRGIKAVSVEVMALSDTNTRFKVQLANGSHMKSFNWQSEFKVKSTGDFQRIDLPISSFWPTLYGHVITAPGNVDIEKVDCLGIILSHMTVDSKENPDFVEGDFDLAVRSIGVVKK